MIVGRRPLRRAPSSTLNVPTALMSKSVRGSVTEEVTATWPAKRKIVSASATAACTAAKSRVSPIRIRRCELSRCCCSHATLFWFPRRRKASKTVTSNLSASRLLTRFDPTKPAPPTTRTLFLLTWLAPWTLTYRVEAHVHAIADTPEKPSLRTVWVDGSDWFAPRLQASTLLTV